MKNPDLYYGETLEEEIEKLNEINAELLEACENLVANLDCYDTCTEEERSEALENARNIIYKAKGE